eukprot:GILJ01007876.1.p1 GENE.GILJ01007876.1~~GILJ01007876.1.p1  ORF type:complete len:471 (+),score=71.94 GILJ01007876.1:33-1445(+)
MVKTVSFAETSHFTSLASLGVSVQAGLLAGQTVAGRDQVLLVIPTPQQTDKFPTNLKQLFGENGFFSWVKEHARQVNRMLCGGTKLLGVYIFSPADAFSQNQAQCIESVRMAMSADTLVRSDICLPSNAEGDSDPLILHVDSKTLKYSCKTYDVAAKWLKPAEIKPQRGQGNRLETLTSAMDVHILILVDSRSKEPVRNLIQAAVTNWCKTVETCAYTVDDNWCQPEDLLGSLSPSPLRHVDLWSRQLTDVCVYKPPADNLHKEENATTATAATSKSGSIFSIRGSLSARAFAFEKSSIADCVNAIKQDLMNSLTTRISALVEELDRQQETDSNVRTLDKPACELIAEQANLQWLLPKRVLIRHPDSLWISDYLLTSETVEDVLERVKVFFGITVDPDSVEAPEDFCDARPVAQRSAVKPREREDDSMSRINSDLVEKKPMSTVSNGSFLPVSLALVGLLCVVIAWVMSS